MKIRSHLPNQNYRINWDSIFNKGNKQCKNQQCLCSGACKNSEDGQDPVYKALKKSLRH